MKSSLKLALKHCVGHVCLCAKSPLLCPTLCHPKDLSLPGSSAHGIFQARNTRVGSHFLLQGIFPNPGIEPMALTSPALAGGFLTLALPGKSALDRRFPISFQMPSFLSINPPLLPQTFTWVFRGL